MQNQVEAPGFPREPDPVEDSMTWKQRGLIVVLVLFALVLLTGVVLAVIAMLNNPAATQTIRDIVIVFLALESLLIGIALVILIVQLAQLTILIQQEVKPILDSTNETMSTLRGTTSFLSENIVRPVVKASGSVAAFKRALDLFKPSRFR